MPIPAFPSLTFDFFFGRGSPAIKMDLTAPPVGEMGEVGDVGGVFWTDKVGGFFCSGEVGGDRGEKVEGILPTDDDTGTLSRPLVFTEARGMGALPCGRNASLWMGCITMGAEHPPPSTSSSTSSLTSSPNTSSMLVTSSSSQLPSLSWSSASGLVGRAREPTGDGGGSEVLLEEGRMGESWSGGGEKRGGFRPPALEGSGVVALV